MMSAAARSTSCARGGKKLLGDKHPARGALRAALGGTLEGHVRAEHLFEEMGFHYTGPIDGHDIDALVQTLRTMLKDLKGPQLLHVITTKGKGYELAEGDQIEYHAVGPFDPRQGPGQEGGRQADLHPDLRRLAVRHGRRR
jgi:1-deoxy-D-xylulose-5-phosphate synthase